MVSDREYAAVEPDFPLSRDQKFVEWADRLTTLPSSKASILEATDLTLDGRRMKDLQVLCSPIGVRPVKENASTIAEQLVLLAVIDGIHVGYCVSSLGRDESGPLFIQVVAVVPEARRRGIGLALLTAVAEREPERDVALATRDDNDEARSLSEQFAKSIGASIGRVSLGTYKNSDLAITQGNYFRPWLIQRSPIES